MQKFVYNSDNTIEVIPMPVLKRWEKYRKTKEEIEKLKNQISEYGSNISEKVLMSDYEKLSQLEERLKIMLPTYDRKNRSVNGYVLNKNAKKRVRLILNMYLRFFKHEKKRLEFVTFTLPVPEFKTNKRYEDSRINKQFGKMLNTLKKSGRLRNYVYVIERQKETKQIHYHCIFHWNKQLSVQNLNLYWLFLLRNIGYPTATREGIIKMIEFFNIDKQVFKRQIGKALLHRDIFYLLGGVHPLNYNFDRILNPHTGLYEKNPLGKFIYNPVDYRPITSRKKLTSYLTKYVTKNNDRIYCRVWSATKKLLTAVLSYTGSQVERALRNIDEYVLKIYVKDIEIAPDRVITYTKYYIDYTAEETNKFIRYLQRFILNRFLLHLSG